MVIDAPEFRRVLGHWPTGVAVVTARARDGRPRGLTANAITSVSLDPPLVLVCVDLGADTRGAIEESAAFVVNVLDAGSESLARRFADEGRTDKFGDMAYRSEASGAPVLDAALAWIDCALETTHEGGDHVIYVGRVLAGGARNGEPLLFFRGGYGRLPR